MVRVFVTPIASAEIQIAMPSIPSDLTQFSIAGLFRLILSLAVPLGIATYNPIIGGVFFAIVCLFWFGYSLLLVADLIDNRPIDQRSCLSQIFNLTGVIIIALSIITASAAVLFTTILLFSWLMGEIPSDYLNLRQR